eukprot:CAMPEP_0195528456 /NCGR_PEP_ID=MMETSP0794_2-20130614/30602_1 /TAXON_ID=515487 /ORGANISM="Stephanopyxis turris, Strain CCMP 815" /LENGTH=399 /DNA_ID=CAMNT_0040659595 /DNA_START=20 /DNA_END=1219 /DNA_ORIENTATION=+
MADASGDTSSPPPFHHSLHTKYITSLAAKIDSPKSYEGAVTEHLRMSGIYWSITALSLLKSPSEVDALMKLKPGGGNNNDDEDEKKERLSIVDWVFECYDPSTGGFGGNIGHDGHMLYTLSAIQILAVADCLSDSRLQVDNVAAFIGSLQQPDGSFAGDVWGEVDTRFSYCALSCLSILGLLPTADQGEEGIIDVKNAVEYVASCRNFDGGFGCVPGAESHAGQIFCCVGALAIANSLHLLDAELLSWWLAERQCDSGGLNGRPEKQADVCYSWWILSALTILGRVSYINTDKLVNFILECQDGDDGGIADRPDDMADVFHTFFGISGLSLLGYFKDGKEGEDVKYREVDPLYALPTDVVERLNLGGQVVRVEGTRQEVGAARLKRYDVMHVARSPLGL